jgi:hypothetical protein
MIYVKDYRDDEVLLECRRGFERTQRVVIRLEQI